LFGDSSSIELMGRFVI